jgi:hypothetical protein
VSPRVLELDAIAAGKRSRASGSKYRDRLTRNLTISPDGQKFLVPVAVGANAAAPYTVVLNWQATLKK